MKITIAGKEYDTPEFSAADFDDWREQIEIVNNTAKERSYMDLQAASIKVIVGFLQANFPELTDERAIKKAIPNSRVIAMFGELLYGKKDAAPPTQTGA
jgi:hypothetical protein